MSTPPKITLVLRAPDGQTLDQVLPFVQVGAPVAIGRGMAVIAGNVDGDLVQALADERDERQARDELCQLALSAPTELAAHAQEMYDLLRLINLKVGGLDAAMTHGMEISDEAWAEREAALEAIWPLLERVHGIPPSERATAGVSSSAAELECALALEADPRDLFIKANPIGATANELAKGRAGFVDRRANNAYLIFLSGLRAAKGGAQ